MNIIVDDSLVYYSLQLALITDEHEKVRFICSRIESSLEYATKPLCLYLLDEMSKHDIGRWEYLKQSPVIRLKNSICERLKEFA